jgi:hypothetical protein
MSSLNVTVKAARADISEYVETSAHNQALNLSDLFRRAAMGMEGIEMEVSTASVDPVHASGSITITYANLAADDLVTVGGVTFTCVASGANGTTQFNKVTDATATAASLVTAINANTTVKQYVTASSALGVVSIIANTPGAIGNLVALTKTEATPGAFTLSAAALASGAGGISSAPTVHNLGHT